jgi:hypothetical protein
MQELHFSELDVSVAKSRLLFGGAECVAIVAA